MFNFSPKAIKIWRVLSNYLPTVSYYPLFEVWVFDEVLYIVRYFVVSYKVSLCNEPVVNSPCADVETNASLDYSTTVCGKWKCIVSGIDLVESLKGCAVDL